MKVISTVPFEFRAVSLKKGESEFDAEKLNTSERAHFDDLVKAEVVKILDSGAADAARKPGDSPEGFTGSPAPNSLPALDATASPYNQTPPAAADEIARRGVEKANAPVKAPSTDTTTTTTKDPFLPTPPNEFDATLPATTPATTPSFVEDGSKPKTSKKL